MFSGCDTHCYDFCRREIYTCFGCLFPDFFSQNHDWILPTVDQVDLNRLSYTDIGYMTPAVMETKQASLAFPGPSTSQAQGDGSLAGGSGFGIGKRKSTE